ncbi:MAG: hypothetical protein R6U36_08060 [Candidatus Fermentibacteraceae bacterium]
MQKKSGPRGEEGGRLLARLAGDATSGASMIYRRVLLALADGTAFPPDIPRRLREMAGDMAPLRFLARRLEGADDPAAEAGRLLAEMDGRLRKLAGEARPLLAGSALICHSNSGTVISVLSALSPPPEAVFQTLSLPGGEGRSAAEALSGKGLRASLVNDAQAPELVRGHGLLPVMGADAVTADYLVNKVGSARIVEAAREEGLEPVFLAGPEKRVEAEEYGRRPKSPLFERVPLQGVRVVGVNGEGSSRCRC